MRFENRFIWIVEGNEELIERFMKYEFKKVLIAKLFS